MATVTKRKTSHITEPKYVNPEAKTFGQRASQIKEVKNIAIRPLVQKSGLSKAVIEATLNGTRYPESYLEIEKLASGFGIKPGRLKGDDLKELKQFLDEIIMSKTKFEKGLEKIEQLEKESVCLNDDLDVLYYRGRILRGLNRITEAEKAILQAFSLVVKQVELSKMESSDERFIRASHEIVQLYYYSGQPDKVIEFVDDMDLKGYFIGNSNQKATLLHYQGLSAYSKKDYDSAKKYYRDAICFYMVAGKSNEAGRVEASLGNILYLDSQKIEALEYFRKAIDHQETDTIYNKSVTFKEFSRSLIGTGHKEEALSVVQKALSFIKENQLYDQEITCKLLLMQGDLTDDIETLESILDYNSISEQLKINTHDLLAKKYIALCNAEKANFHHSTCVDILKSCNTYEDYRKGEWV